MPSSHPSKETTGTVASQYITKHCKDKFCRSLRNSETSSTQYALVSLSCDDDNKNHARTRHTPVSKGTWHTQSSHRIRRSSFGDGFLTSHHATINLLFDYLIGLANRSGSENPQLCDPNLFATEHNYLYSHILELLRTHVAQEYETYWKWYNGHFSKLYEATLIVKMPLDVDVEWVSVLDRVYSASSLTSVYWLSLLYRSKSNHFQVTLALSQRLSQSQYPHLN